MGAQQRPPSPRRSFLFTPADSWRKLEKVASLAADVVIIDLEDGVTVSQKDNARENMVAALAELSFGRAERLVRVNATDTPFHAADVAALAGTNVAGIVLPKTEAAVQLQDLDNALGTMEKAAGRPVGSIRLFALIETARGVLNMKDIAGAGARLDALLFGAEDLAADLGVKRTAAGWEIFYARSSLVMAAAAHGLAAIDTVFVGFNDLEGLEAEARFARELGYSGKLLIHPRQVTVCNRVFAPSEAEVTAARRLLQEYEAWQEKGVGVFEVDGRMVDRPMVRAAERLLERHRHCEEV